MSVHDPIAPIFQVQTQSHQQSELFLFAFPPLIILFQSKENEAAKALIQEVFLLCSCIKKVTVVESLIPDEWTTAAHTGFNI